MTDPTSLPPGYFDAVYAAHADPWNFEGSDYERDKYAVTLAALPRARYARAFEVGCSIGVFTQLLADRCDRLLAVDVSDAALAIAHRRLASRAHVQVEKMVVPGQFPKQQFDLVMLSEVGYYWSPIDLARASGQIVTAMLPGGHLMLVHWTPPVHDYPSSGDAVHGHFMAMAGPAGPLIHRHGMRAETYRLDLFERSALAADQPG